jgi:hypothetical protein
MPDRSKRPASTTSGACRERMQTPQGTRSASRLSRWTTTRPVRPRSRETLGIGREQQPLSHHPLGERSTGSAGMRASDEARSVASIVSPRTTSESTATDQRRRLLLGRSGGAGHHAFQAGVTPRSGHPSECQARLPLRVEGLLTHSPRRWRRHWERPEQITLGRAAAPGRANQECTSQRLARRRAMRQSPPG